MKVFFTILLCLLAVLLIGTETIFVAPLLDMANIPDAREQMVVAFGIVTGCVVCLESAVTLLDRSCGWKERLIPIGVIAFLTLFMGVFGLMRGLMTYSLSHGQLKIFLMGAYRVNMLFWMLITFLPPLAAALLFHEVRKKKEELQCPPTAA